MYNLYNLTIKMKVMNINDLASIWLPMVFCHLYMYMSKFTVLGPTIFELHKKNIEISSVTLKMKVEDINKLLEFHDMA